MTTVLEGIQEKTKGKAEVLYTKGCDLVDAHWPESEIIDYPLTDDEQAEIDKAVENARQADVAVVVLGGGQRTCGENKSRTSLDLPGRQLQLLQAIQATGKPVVLILINGRPLSINWADKFVPAILEAWYPGSKGGTALADILFGDYNPGGKLTVTFPKTVGQIPFNFPCKPSSQIDGGKNPGPTGNMSRINGALYPFGYGLSYTTFEYSDLKADEKGVTLTVTNTGSCAGAEIVQLYVAKPDAKIFRPAQELKGFAKVFLAPGESRTVSIALDDKAFRYWNVKTDRWEVEGGSYQLRVGASSADIRLTAEVSVKGTNAPDPYEGLDLLHYVSGQITYVTDAEFEALLGHPVPEDVVRIDRNMTLGEMDHGRSPLGWVAQKVLRCRLDSSFAKGTPDLNTVFQYNMPLRALAKMTNGMVSMGMVDGLVWELKGFWLVGILRVIYEFVKNLILNSQMENRLKNS